MRWQVAIASILVLGCIEPGTRQCGQLVCPDNMLCAAALQRCVDPDQAAACQGRAEGDECSAGAAPNGSCTAGYCVASVCGDGVVSGTEECESDDLGDRDCTSLGYYQPEGLACASDCTFDVSGCEQFCGDQITNGPEICDGSLDPDLSCVSFGRDYGAPACGPLCFPSIESCQFIGFGTSTYPGIGARDIWVADTDNAFIVGDDGLLLALDERNEWSPVDTGQTISADLLAIWGHGDQLFVTSSAGDVLHFDGQSWARQELVVGTALNDVHGSSASDVWVVGDEGSAFHFDGTQWVVVNVLDTDIDLNLVQRLSGATYIAGENTIFEDLGEGFQAQLLPGPPPYFQTHTISSLRAYSPDLVYAALDSEEPSFEATVTTTLFRWSTAGWTTSSTPAGHALLLAGTAARPMAFGREVGGAQVSSRIDAQWVPWFVDREVALVALATGADGSTLGVENNGAVRRYQGLAWATVGAPPPVFGDAFPRLRRAAPRSPTSMFAIRNDYFDGENIALTSELWEYDEGTGWQSRSDELDDAGADTVGWRDIARVGGELYIVGPEVWRYGADGDAVTWTLETGGGVYESIWASGPSDIYVVGRGDRLVHFDGSEWTSVDTGIDDFGAHTFMTGSGPSDVWVTTGGGSLKHFDGSSWELIDTGSQTPVTAVWTSGPGDVWALNREPGRALHFDGTTWSISNTGVPAVAIRIDGTAPDDVFIITISGIARFDGSRWAPVRSIPGRSYLEVTADESGGVYFLGQGFETLLRE